MDFDHTYIKIALFNLKRIVGTTFPNPPVFSILVESDKNFNNTKIVSFGITGFSGRPHAECNAIESFKFKNDKEYTLYSTLEPCCHLGRDESCVSKIIKSKFIKRVVFSKIDPDPRVNGKGKKILIKNKIKVLQIENNEKISNDIYKGYSLNRAKNRPRVLLKLAMSINGQITDKKNTRRKITNHSSNKFSQILRSEVDAILVGSNTLKVDDCKLTCRIEGLKKFSPIRVVLSKSFDIKTNLKIFDKNTNIKTIIITQNKCKKKMSLFSNANVEIVLLDQKEYNLTFILKKLANIGISNLLVEGGAKIFTSFFKEGLFDDIYIFRSNFFLGGSGLNAIMGSGIDFSKIILKKTQMINFGNNTLEILTKEM